jgi:hypothetical protein
MSGVYLHCWLKTYDESSNMWADFIVPETDPMPTMQGFAVWSSSINPWSQWAPPLGDTTTHYIGTPNFQSQSVGLTNTVDGWNFVGNPYPSALDWEADGWTKTNLTTDMFAIWNGTAGDYAQYTVGSGGINDGTQYIPSTQGFFVQCDAGGGTLGVNDASRVYSVQAFWKNSQELFAQRLSLTLSNGTNNDETVIFFNSNASTGIDYSYDARKFFSSTTAQLFTMSGQYKMAINTLNNPDQSDAIPMGIAIPQDGAGQDTISASNIESIDASTPIYLEDLKEKNYVDLRQNATYSFAASPQDDPLRFIVHFKNTLGIADPGNTSVTNIYSYNKDVYVNFTGSNGEIVIYNLLGQEVSRKNAENGLNKISLTQSNSAYVVKVISNQSVVSQKVFVK